ncbi:MAG: hypothetical protein AB7N80_16015 [Bdellovibrionales bacterium]
MRLFSVLLFVLCLIAPGAYAKRAQRQVEVQWEAHEDAQKYIVEIRHRNGKLLKTFESAKPLLKFHAPVGDYEIRAQVLTHSGQPGMWSDWNPLMVSPKAIKWQKAAGKPISIAASPTTLSGTMTLSWPREATAEKYAVKIYDAEKKLFKEILVEQTAAEPRAQLDLPPGQYTYSVTSQAAGFYSDEIFSPQKLTVDSAQLPDIELKVDPKKAGHFSWPAKTGVVYRAKLERVAFLSENWQVVVDDEIIKNSGQWRPTADLPPGRYRLQVWSEAVSFKSAPPTQVEFVIKPTESRLSNLDDELKSRLQEK